MGVTKEECIEALEDIEMSLCELEELKTHVDVNCIFNESLEKLKQVANEHFDNPPLEFEELKNMIGKPVYHNILKRNFIIENVEIGKYGEKKNKVRDCIIDYLIYMEDCFYAREVKE